MEEKIIEKIEELIEYIISKSADAMTLNDYTILHEELKDIRFRREQSESNDRLRQLMATTLPGVFNGMGKE